MNLLFVTTLIIVIKHSVVSEESAKVQKIINSDDFQKNLEEALKFGLISVLKKENNEKMGPIKNWTANPDKWVTVKNFESNNIRKIEPKFAYEEDFIFASYGSIAFRALRQTWAINKSLMKSLNSGPLIGQCSAGNSGCGFYHTQDSQFMLKSILGEEETFFQHNNQAFHHYYSYMMEKSSAKRGQSTLLVKYLGFFRFIILPKNQLRENFNLPFVVMPNIFPTNFPIDWKFDLKGTLDESRRSLDRNPMIKDIEFVDRVEGLFKKGIDFYSKDYEWLFKVLESDFEAMAKMGRYDYSLILSIHILNNRDVQDIRVDRKKGILLAYCKSCTLPTGAETDIIPAGSQLRYTTGKQLLVLLGIVDTLKPYSTLKSAIAKIHKEIHQRPRVIASPHNYAKRFFDILKKKYFFLDKTEPSKSTGNNGITNGFARIGSFPQSGVKVRS